MKPKKTVKKRNQKYYETSKREINSKRRKNHQLQTGKKKKTANVFLDLYTKNVSDYKESNARKRKVEDKYYPLRRKLRHTESNSKHHEGSIELLRNFNKVYSEKKQGVLLKG